MAENNYDLEYTGPMVDRILDTGYDLQNQGYIFRGLASHYTGTPTERTWLIAPTGSTGFGLSSPVPPGSIGICMYNGSSWYAEVLNTLTLDTAPTTNSGNGITSGAVKTLAESITNAIGQLDQSVSDRFTSLELEDTTGSLQAEVLSITLKYVFEGETETLTSLSILAATAEKAGLMSASDKQKLDAFVTNIRSLRIQDTTAQADQGTEITNTMKWTIGGVTEAITAFTLYAATTSKAGLMSAADKTALDTLPSLINAGYLYAGIATPSTVPSSTSAKIYYIAIEGGTYTSFGNLNVTQGINIIYKSGNAWSVAQVVGIDNEPTAGSDNLVKSGGVADAYGTYRNASEYLKVIVDNNNKLIEATKNDGTKVLPAGTDIDGNLTKSVLNPEFIQVTVDNKGKILDCLKKDGTRYFQKLSSPEIELLNEKVDDIAGASKKNLFHYDATPDGVSYILSPFNDDYYIKTYFNVRREEEAFTHNSCFNFNSVALVNKDTLSEVTVDSCADDIAPGKWNSGYIGANHGLDDMKRCTCVSHDKTYADIGSVWSCNGANYTIVGVAPNYLYLIGENILTYPLFMMATVPSSGEFVHVSGATHTNSFTTTAAVMNQMWNQTRPVSLNISADGKPVTESGDYKFNILDICEVYDVINQADSLAEIKRRVGTFTANPIFTKLANVNSAARHSTTYSFNNAGSWRIAVDYTAIQNIVLDYFGFTQMAVLPGDNIKLYIPKALPISNGEETIDFRTIAPHNNVPATMNLTSEYWENPQLPPDRWLEYSENIGVASGYLFDYGVGGENRKDNINNAFFLYTSRKVYPHGIDSKISLQAGESKSAVVFRSYKDVDKINKNGIILANTVEYNGALYLYVDFNAAGMYNIEIPADYCGKTIAVFEKSSNVDLISSISSGRILVKVSSSNPMYGYLVAQIK